MATELAQARRSAATPRTTTNARALTAAGQKLDPTNTREAALQKSFRQDWQHDAWAFYRLLPEIHFGHDYFRNVCSRVRIYPGYQADPDDAPSPLDDLDTDAEMPEGADKGTVAAAIDEMQRLDQGYDGGLPALTGDFGINIGLVGEAWLHGMPDLETGLDKFAVYSTEELKATDSGYEIFKRGGSQGRLVTEDEYVMRAWRRLAQYRDLADAPMMALLSTCDTLRMLNQVLFASAASRAHGGIYKVPSEWSFPQRATDPNAAGQATDDPLNEQMMTAFTTPLTDPSSVGSVMPLLVRGPADTLDKGGWEDLGRGYGLELLKQIEGVRHSIAVGLDLPPEVLEGVGTTNHWGAWQVALDTFKSHIEPLIQVICRSLTDGYLWPALRSRGLDPTGFSVWYDPTALIGQDNDFDVKKALHEAFAISDDALRRAGGASEDDAPDEDEIQRRIYIAQQLRVTERVTAADTSNTLEGPDALDSAPGTAAPGVNTPPSPADTAKQAPPATPALAASGGRQSNLRQLGPRLADIDRVLTAQIQTLADTALQRTLERAGAAVARKVQGARQGQRKTGLAAEIQAVDLDMVPAHVGRDQVLALGLSEDKLIDGQLGQLEPQYRKLTKRALAAALLAGNRAVPDRELSEERQREIEAAQDAHISAGFVVLSAGVLAAAHEQLFTPAQQQAGPGEIDLSTRISRSVVRESLSVAGGTPVAKALTPAADVQPPGAVATGQLVMDAFKEALEILPQSWQWVYGYPDKPFEPHEVLEGVEFSSWQDDVLLNDGDWPDTPYFAPGDHGGCACSFIPVWAEDRPNDTPSGDNEAPPEEG